MMSRGVTIRRGSVALLTLVLIAAGVTSCVPQPNGGISCAWPNVSNGETLNIAYPDAGATYFTTRYQLTAGQQLVLHGTYPFARYMSLHTYTLAGADVDHALDAAIAPDPGSDNPFTDAAASAEPSQRRWTVTISTDVAAGTAAANNTLAAGPSAGSFANGAVILRVYVPDAPDDLAGGVDLPTMSVRSADGTLTSVPTCPAPTPDSGLVDLVSLFGPATDVPAADPPVFKRPLTVVGLYPNRDNAYLAAIAAYQPGKVVVVRGRAPTTPDTRAGEAVTAPTQLRYWSFCSNEYRKPYPVTDCGFDHQIPIDSFGNYTIVVSTPAERPANATLANGVFWLDWGNTAVDMLLSVRHMLPAAAFTEAVQNLELGQLASPQMGPYAPVAARCAVGAFESGGAAACGL